MILRRHQMEIFSALLDLCDRHPPVTGGFFSQRPVTRRFDVFFDCASNNRDAGDLRLHYALITYDVTVMDPSETAPHNGCSDPMSVLFPYCFHKQPIQLRKCTLISDVYIALHANITFSVLLTLSEGNHQLQVDIPKNTQKSVAWMFCLLLVGQVFLNKHSSCRWFEWRHTLMWRQCNALHRWGGSVAAVRTGITDQSLPQFQLPGIRFNIKIPSYQYIKIRRSFFLSL